MNCVVRAFLVCPTYAQESVQDARNYVWMEGFIEPSLLPPSTVSLYTEPCWALGMQK
jgi:hypothetical protein